MEILLEFFELLNINRSKYNKKNAFVLNLLLIIISIILHQGKFVHAFFNHKLSVLIILIS